MKRVKLFDLSETVQAVCIKNTSDDDKPSITFQIYTFAHEAWVNFSWEAKFKSQEVRDENFEKIQVDGIATVYNHVIIENGLPLETILLTK